MSLAIDAKYAAMLGPYLRNFKQLGPFKFRWSCHLCGDSASVKTKARAFLFPAANRLGFVCHNCNEPTSFRSILKQLDGNLFHDYIVECFAEEKPERPTDVFKPPSFQRQIDPKLEKISTLDVDHPAKRYVMSRLLPTKLHYQLYYISNFPAWSATLSAETDVKNMRPHGRLIIPLIDIHQNVIGYQGRSLYGEEPKYITIMLDANAPKAYGMDRVNLNERVYVFEGPIDAMFLPNSVATAGGRLDTVLPKIHVSRTNSVIVYDNEPRSIHTVEKITKAVEDGYYVCIWPLDFRHKDVNDAVLAGMTPEEVHAIIDSRTFKGLKAHFYLQEWKKTPPKKRGFLRKP